MGGQPDHEQHARAREFLQQCRERTRDSAERLRRHLTYANEFGELLDARTHPCPGPGPEVTYRPGSAVSRWAGSSTVAAAAATIATVIAVNARL
ncbi:hypothetical protein HGA13_29675 [Nocardia speluncae]|uniref:Uncharacterized protein n=1 Tax=Nocardia speluncae TaxID=419477 RepID=A0A846XR15_9NOCA|nr:hypothetical protein [Nocardia speluncae]NKY37210.1 hypothetical protein [Nocardia speluncae]